MNLKLAPKRPAFGRTLPAPRLRKKLSKSSRILLTASSYPPPPAELAGRWVAWSEDARIVAADDTLAGLVKQVNNQGLKNVSYERVPRLHRG